MRSDIVDLLFVEAVEIESKVPQLIITHVVIERQDGNAVVHVEGKTGGRVVDYYQVLQISVTHNPEVLDQSKVSFDAVFSVEPSGEELSVGVDEVQHSIRIQLVARSIGHQLKALLKIPEAIEESWSHVDVDVQVVRLVFGGIVRTLVPLQVYPQLFLPYHCCWVVFVNAVNKCFI